MRDGERFVDLRFGFAQRPAAFSLGGRRLAFSLAPRRPQVVRHNQATCRGSSAICLQAPPATPPLVLRAARSEASRRTLQGAGPAAPAGTFEAPLAPGGLGHEGGSACADQSPRPP